MPERAWKIAVIDSGLAPWTTLRPRQARRFVDEGSGVSEREPGDDPSGHGSKIAAIIASASRRSELVIAQVLDQHGRGTAAAVAAAVRWAGAQGAQLLHLSLGLAQDRGVLRAAIEESVAAGRIVIASAPARGAPVFPAAYPGVIRATGDARCGLDEISRLGTPQADFGACPVNLAQSGTCRGASIGAAHLSRFIVSHAAPGSPPQSVRSTLERLAAFHGRERRQAV